MDANEPQDLHWRIANAVLGTRTAALRFDPISHHVVAGATRQIERLHCTQADGTQHEFVVKHIRHDPAQDSRWRTSDDPASSFYWRREADFYASARPWPDLPELRSARPSYVQRTKTSAVVVLEALSETTAAGWKPEALLKLAEPLAETQAKGHGSELPDTDTPFLDAYVARRGALMEEAEALIQTTGLYAVDALAESRHDIAVLQAATGPLLADFAAMPQVFSHNDFWQPNLLRGADGAAVLIDFAHCGLSAAGQDAANLVIDGIADGLIDPDLGRELFDTFLSLYAKRFADLSGAASVAAIVENSLHAMALKYAWLIPATFKAAHSEDSRKRLAERYGSAERFLSKRAQGLRVVADLIAKTAAAYR